jgi:hypothetical protein
VVTFQNIAQVKASFIGVTDGESFYREFCAVTAPISPIPTATSTASVAATPTASVQSRAVDNVPGYPEPIAISSDHVVSGYFLDGSPYDDVAVLAVLNFEPHSPAEFQAVVDNFISEAKKNCKTKIIVDLSSNGGGYILQGYDLYRQFFPHTVQDGFGRFREQEMLLTIAEVISNEIPPNYDPHTASHVLIQDYETPFNFRFDLNRHDRSFSSFEDKFSPHRFQGDDYTSIVRWNLNDPLLTTNTTFGIGMEITGYGARRNFTQPFAAEDIIMVNQYPSLTQGMRRWLTLFSFMMACAPLHAPHSASSCASILE